MINVRGFIREPLSVLIIFVERLSKPQVRNCFYLAIYLLCLGLSSLTSVKLNSVSLSWVRYV